MFKKVLLILICLSIMFNSVMPVMATNESTYSDASEKLQRANIIIVRPVENPFKEVYDASQVTRAEFSLIILNALREDVPPVAEKSYFQDCNIKDWYTPYINKLFELKIVSGYGDDTFKPKNIVTNFEAVTMLIRCLGYDAVKTESETYPHKYLEIAEQLQLFKNTSINKTIDEPITNGNMFVLLLNAMRSNINESSQKLWDYGLETSSYKKVTGKVISANAFEYIVKTDTENINLIWNYDENISAYLDKEVSVWFYQNDNKNYAIDMIIK